jgi:hypothetical protein
LHSLRTDQVGIAESVGRRQRIGALHGGQQIRCELRTVGLILAVE